MNVKYIKTTDNKKYDLRDKRITDTDTGIATQSANGLLSSTDKKKLDGIASGAEVNQNAFSNVKIGNTTIAADGKTDTVELTAGNNITLTPDATNDKITIAATNTNTTYTFKGGTNQFTVTPSNGTAQTVSVTPSIANNVTGSDLTANTIILGNGNSGVKKSGKTIVTTLGSDDTTLPTSKAVKAAIDALPEPMIFKGTLGTNGTITSLPTAAASNEGYTYKVITAGTYASQSAKTGDVFISNGSSWNLIPSGDEPSGTVTNIATGTGLTGGPITSSGTISHADTSSQASVSNSGRTYIQSITLDGMGHVTGIASATETVTNTDTKVTSAANHYAPAEDTSSQLDADASSTTAATWNSTSLVTGVTVKRDAKGHVVGLGVDSIKMPANPNTDNKVCQTLTSHDINLPLLMSYNSNTTTADTFNIVFRNNSIYANPSTGTITANKFNGNASSASKLTTDAGSSTKPVYFSNGVPTAISYTINKSVPSNAVFTDTHYTTHLYAGSGTAANAATTNGNTKLTVVDNTTTRNSVTIKGTGETTVESDANGAIIINSVNKTSKWFNFSSPSKVDNAFYFIISPIGTSTATSSGTCYSIEINAIVQSSAGNYIVSNTKFVIWCYWYASSAGLRITYPVYSNSEIPIYYHNKAEGAGIGNETGSSNVCNIPIKVENVESLAAVNIKVDGPGVSDCICTRSYSSFNWGQDEPTSWSSI